MHEQKFPFDIALYPYLFKALLTSKAPISGGFPVAQSQQEIGTELQAILVPWKADQRVYGRRQGNQIK